MRKIPKFPTARGFACGDVVREEVRTDGVCQASVSASMPSPSLGKIVVRSIDWNVRKPDGDVLIVETWCRTIREARRTFVSAYRSLIAPSLSSGEVRK